MEAEPPKPIEGDGEEKGEGDFDGISGEGEKAPGVGGGEGGKEDGIVENTLEAGKGLGDGDGVGDGGGVLG